MHERHTACYCYTTSCPRFRPVSCQGCIMRLHLHARLPQTPKPAYICSHLASPQTLLTPSLYLPFQASILTVSRMRQCTAGIRTQQRRPGYDQHRQQPLPAARRPRQRSFRILEHRHQQHAGCHARSRHRCDLGNQGVPGPLCRLQQDQAHDMSKEGEDDDDDGDGDD